MGRQHLKLWFKYAREFESPVQSAYLQAVLLTVARRRELSALKWTDVDVKWHRMELSDNVEERRTISLPPYLAGQLRELHRLNNTRPNVRQLRRLKREDKEWTPSIWVFRSLVSASGHLEEPKKAHIKILELAGSRHVSIHDLRRSFGSLSQWCEIPSGVIP
ncbi:MAG: hypothetical protein ABI155_15295 [Paralcaligenes sp.]